MPVAAELFLKYGYFILFAWVMAEQLGLPLPSVPVMLTAGTLSATHKMNLPVILITVVAACLLSDSIWYWLGKRFGGTMVRILCKLSLESASCVRRTEDLFGRHGATGLLYAKFLPGFSTMAAPIAGQTGMPYQRFLLYDAGGSLLWGTVFVLAGRFFGDAIKRNAHLLHFTGRFAVVLVVLLVLGFLAWRITNRQLFLRQIRTLRVKPLQVKQMMDAGEKVFIVDLRHPLDYLPDPRILPGAVRLGPDELVSRSGDIPRDRDIILYCTCPSEATSAKVALRMRKLGIRRVRPLEGGFDAWKEEGFPLVDYEEKAAVVS